MPSNHFDSTLLAQTGIDALHVENIYLATPFQQGVLYAALKSQPPGRFFIAVYHIYLPPHTDLDRFRASWNVVVEATSILRTGFILSSQGVLAVVYKNDAPHHKRWFQDVRDELKETEMQVAGQSFVRQIAFQPFSGNVPFAIHVVGNLRAGYHARLSFHHSIFDGLSMVTWMKSLNRLYHQGWCGPSNMLDAPSFAAVAGIITSQHVNAVADYWRQYVKNLPDALWPQAVSLRSQVWAAAETISRYCSVQQHCNSSNLPAFRSRIIRAALALTMSMHSGLDDQIFCETRSSRSYLPSHLQAISGPCLSSQLVRLQCSPSSTLQQLLNDAGCKDTEKALKESQMSLGQVLEAIGAKAAKKVRVFLTVYAAPFWLKNNDIPGWQFLDHWTCHDTPLNIDVFHPRNGACQIRLRYDPSISQYVDSEVPVATSQQYTTVKDVLSHLSHTDAPMTLQYGVGPLNNLELDITNPTYPLIHEMFQEAASMKPNAIALDFEGLHTMTYKELDTRSTRLALELKNRMGVHADEMVCILFNVSFEMIVAIIAVLKAGAAYVPLGVDLPLERMARILDIAGGNILLHGQGTATAHVADLKKRFPALKATPVSLLDGAGCDISSFPKILPKVAGESLAYVFFTSGSTGLPKGVGVEHRNLSAFAHSGQADFTTHPGMRKLLLSPYTFDISVGDIFSTLTSGNTLILVRRDELLSNLPFWLEETRTTHLSMTPSVAHQIPSDSLPCLKYINFVGETVPLDLAARLSQNREIRNTMGPTECVVSSTEWIVPPRSTVNSIGERVTIGLPIGHNNIYILRPSTDELTAIGEVGEICIGGSQVARGYISDPAFSATKFVQDPFSKIPGARMFRSGDLGKWNKNMMIEHMGRMDGQVKFRGLRIETGEIETVITQSNKAVLEVCVDVLDRDGEQLLVAAFTLHSQVVESQEGPCVDNIWLMPLSDEKVKSVIQSAEEACKNLLPRYMRPDIWTCLSSFPRNPNGKLNRQVLKGVVQKFILEDIAPIRKSRQCTNDFRGPIRTATTRTEHIVVSILSQVLGQETNTISLDASFISLGGTSLQAMRVTTAFQNRGIGATVADCLDDRKTVEMLAQLPHIQPRLLTSGEAGERGERNNHFKPYSPFLMSPAGWEEGVKAVSIDVKDVEDVYPCNATARGWVELALQNHGRSLLCQFVHDLGTEIDSDRLARAWKQLCLVEPALRTVFVEIPTSGLITPVVLHPGADILADRGATLEVMTLQDGDEVEKKIEEALREHKLELGFVPIRNWLIQDGKSLQWTFASSRHHALHDAKTLDYQGKELSLLYHQESEAIHALAGKRNLQTSFGAYIHATSNGENKAFWKKYLAGAIPPIWPHPKDVNIGYSKDLSQFQLVIRPWAGSVADLARKIGVVKGAVLRAAYAVAIAEQQDRYTSKATERNNDVLVYEMVEGRGAVGVNELWGFCTHMDVLRVHVPVNVSTRSETIDNEQYFGKLVDVVKDANRSFAITLPAMAQGIEVAEELLGRKVEKGKRFQTSILNILDMSDGDLRVDKRNAEAETQTASNRNDNKPLFVKSLVRSNIVGFEVPLYMEIHVTKQDIKFVCSYDADIVKQEEMDRVVQKLSEVMDTLSTGQE